MVGNNCQTVKDGEYSRWESKEWQYVDKKGKFVTYKAKQEEK